MRRESHGFDRSIPDGRRPGRHVTASDADERRQSVRLFDRGGNSRAKNKNGSNRFRRSKGSNCEIMKAEQFAASGPVDAFTTEVIRSTVVAITDEMKTNLMRTAYNIIIYEAEDFTVGLFDADGNTISIGLGLPMFIRGLSDAIKAKIAFWGKENIAPGDILLTNDSYKIGRASCRERV